jgi:UDP-glucuronate 4-epimerase
LENELGKTATKQLPPTMRGDFVETRANIDALARDFDFRPETSVEEGVRRFIAWYHDYLRL